MNARMRSKIYKYMRHIDYLGLFNKSTGNKKYIFVVVDAFTKFVFLQAVKSTTPSAVVNFLEEIFKIYGISTRIVSG